MPLKTTFVVQAFVLKRKRLVPGDREIVSTESGALKKARALADRMPGAAALRVTADDETGELESVVVLESFGEVPEDFLDSLAGG